MGQIKALAVQGGKAVSTQAVIDEVSIDPRLAMAAKAIQLMAGQNDDGTPKISADMALAAAMYQAGTGQLLGRDFYVNDKVGRMEGYRGVARDANERGVGEVQIKYRSLTTGEATEHEIEPGDMAVACEVYQLRAWQQAQRLGVRYEPIVGIGVVRDIEKYEKKSTQKWNDAQKRYEALPKAQWRQTRLEGGMTWHKKAQNRAYKDALRHTPGMSASPEEVIAEAAHALDELPPVAARLTMEQAHAWVEEHGISGDVEPDGVVEGEYTEQATPEPPTLPAYKRLPRPWPAAVAIEALRDAASSAKHELAANGQWGALIGLLDSAPFDTQQRHRLLREVFGVESSKLLSGAQRYALHAWAKPAKIGDTWAMDANAVTEYQAIVNENRITDAELDGDEPLFS